MKQCPVCKTNYTDDSLSFCLSDGTPLEFVSDGQITQIKPFGNERIQIDFGNSNPTAALKTAPNIPSVENQPPKQKSKAGFIVLALGFLFLLIVCCAAAAYFLIPRDNGKVDNTAVVQTPSPTPVQSNDSDELKKKVANLEKQLADQKKTPTPAVTTPGNSPTLTPSGTATARVGPTNDGFLSLRTEPSAQSGAQLVKIPSGATVELENCQKTYTVVDSHRGRWCAVSYNGQMGWVFDAWLIY